MAERYSTFTLTIKDGRDCDHPDCPLNKVRTDMETVIGVNPTNAPGTSNTLELATNLDKILEPWDESKGILLVLDYFNLGIRSDNLSAYVSCMQVVNGNCCRRNVELIVS